MWERVAQCQNCWPKNGDEQVQFLTITIVLKKNSLPSVVYFTKHFRQADRQGLSDLQHAKQSDLEKRKNQMTTTLICLRKKIRNDAAFVACQ